MHLDAEVCARSIRHLPRALGAQTSPELILGQELVQLKSHSMGCCNSNVSAWRQRSSILRNVFCKRHWLYAGVCTSRVVPELVVHGDLQLLRPSQPLRAAARAEQVEQARHHRRICHHTVLIDHDVSIGKHLCAEYVRSTLYTWEAGGVRLMTRIHTLQVQRTDFP